jgi:GDPmannose 4,6-dehydratase
MESIAGGTLNLLVANYREAYGLFACTGILANHESPLRPNRFVTQKIIQGVKAIAEGKQEKLVLGNLDIWRDWGWAPDYVEAMYRMLQAEKSHDYVIASGKSHSLREFVDTAFEHAGLDPQGRLEVNSGLMRPTDLSYSAMNPGKTGTSLHFYSGHSLTVIVQKMQQNTLF